jgi:hypothetical protein
LAESAHGSRVGDEHINACIEAYAREDPKHDKLKTAMMQSFVNLSEYSPFGETYVKELLTDISTKWDVISNGERSHAYKGGLVRRTSDGVALRASLIAEIFAEAAPRVQQVRLLLDSFCAEAVPHEYREDARRIEREIISHAYQDSLRMLHIGTGKRVARNVVNVNAAVLRSGLYSGSWEIEPDDSILIGDEVWALVWTWDEAPGRRKSETCILPVRRF